MNLETALYLTDILSNLSCLFYFCGTVVVLIGLLVGFWATLGLFNHNELDALFYSLKLIFLKIWPIWIAYLIFIIAVPSKSTMYLMMGSHYLKQTDVPQKVMSILETKLDEYSDELLSKKDKK